MGKFLKNFLFALCLIFTVFASLPIYAADFSIVANDSLRSITSVSRKHLKSIFLGKQKKIKGNEVRPVNIAESANDTVRSEFEQDILEMSPFEMKNYWVEESIKGGEKPPKSLRSLRSLTMFIKKKNGAIGYMKAVDASKSGLHIIALK